MLMGMPGIDRGIKKMKRASRTAASPRTFQQPSNQMQTHLEASSEHLHQHLFPALLLQQRNYTQTAISA